jgi:hypothetical protein
LRTLPSVVPLAVVFSSPVSAPLPRVRRRERDRLRDLVTKISTESILATDGGLRPRALGDEGGDVVVLRAGDDAALRGLAYERRLWREAGVAVAVAVAAGALPVIPTSLSCGSWTRTRTRDRGRGRPRPRAGVDAGVTAVTPSALGFGARALLLPLPLLLAFGPSASTPLAISAMSVSSVPSKPPSSSPPSPSSAGGRARLARPLVLAPAPTFFFAIWNRARMLWQFSWKQESSLSSALVESARKRARFTSVCRSAQR